MRGGHEPGHSLTFERVTRAIWQLPNLPLLMGGQGFEEEPDCFYLIQMCRPTKTFNSFFEDFRMPT